ncbi:MAG: dihydrofolate reductase [Patescibacteria group bacterium]
MINIIVAIAKNNCIGKNGQLPWHIPEDMKHFKELTNGKTVVMGRKTWESLPEKFRPLPDRLNVVVTRQAGYQVPVGVLVFPSLESALAAYKNDETFVIGGAQIYTQALPQTDRLYVTHVDQVIDGDAFFPAIDPLIWKELERDEHEGFSFATYEKI